MFRTVRVGCFCCAVISGIMANVWAQTVSDMASSSETKQSEQLNAFGSSSTPFGIPNRQILNNSLQTITIVSDSVVPKEFQFDKEAYKFGKRMAEKNKTILFADNFATEGAIEMIKGAVLSKGQVLIITDNKTYQKNCLPDSACRQATFISITTPEQQRRYIEHKTDMYVFLPGGWKTIGVFADLMQQTVDSTGFYLPFIPQTKSVENNLMANSSERKENTEETLFKPIVFFNINHFWDNMRYFTEEMNRQGVLSKQQMKYIYFVDKPKDILKTADKMLKKIGQN